MVWALCELISCGLISNVNPRAREDNKSCVTHLAWKRKKEEKIKGAICLRRFSFVLTRALDLFGWCAPSVSRPFPLAALAQRRRVSGGRESTGGPRPQRPECVLLLAQSQHTLTDGWQAAGGSSRLFFFVVFIWYGGGMWYVQGGERRRRDGGAPQREDPTRTTFEWLCTGRILVTAASFHCFSITAAAGQSTSGQTVTLKHYCSMCCVLYWSITCIPIICRGQYRMQWAEVGREEDVWMFVLVLWDSSKAKHSLGLWSDLLHWGSSRPSASAANINQPRILLTSMRPHQMLYSFFFLVCVSLSILILWQYGNIYVKK